MKKTLAKMFGKSALAALVAGTFLAVMSPVSALAQSRGGHGGNSSAGRSYSGQSYSAPRGSSYQHSGSQGYHSGGYSSHGYYGSGYHGPAYGFSLNFGVPYGYYGYPAYGYVAPPPPPPCGYYDQWGYFHSDPACYSNYYAH